MPEKNLASLFIEDDHNFQQTELLVRALGGELVFDETSQDKFFYKNVKVSLHWSSQLLLPSCPNRALVSLEDFRKTCLYRGFKEALEEVGLPEHKMHHADSAEVGYNIGRGIAVGFALGLSKPQQG